MALQKKDDLTLLFTGSLGTSVPVFLSKTFLPLYSINLSSGIVINFEEKVTIIDMICESEIAKDAALVNKIILMDLLYRHGVEFKMEVKLEEITDKGAFIIDKRWQRYEVPADTVVMAMGSVPNNALAAKLYSSVRNLHIIGDCAKPCGIAEAINHASYIARKI